MIISIAWDIKCSFQWFTYFFLSSSFFFSLLISLSLYFFKEMKEERGRERFVFQWMNQLCSSSKQWWWWWWRKEHDEGLFLNDNKELELWSGAIIHFSEHSRTDEEEGEREQKMKENSGEEQMKMMMMRMGTNWRKWGYKHPSEKKTFEGGCCV